MAKIDKQIIVKFGPEEPKTEITQAWPKGSNFLKLIVAPEGIYTYFEVPNVMSVDKGGVIESEEWTFALVLPGSSTQDGDEFLDMLAVYSEVPPAQLKEEGLPSDYQATVVFTFYMRKRPKSSLIVT